MIEIPGPRDPVRLGRSERTVLVAGPCVIEDGLPNGIPSLIIASHIASECARFGVPVIFKASFDKANRTSIQSYRGCGLELGVEILAELRATLNLPVLTDVHEPSQAEPVAAVVDVLQVPAMLCRQTDLIAAVARAAARHGRAVNLKKGQSADPNVMQHAVAKVRAAGGEDLPILLTERGTFFGYGDLVVDMRSLVRLRHYGVGVVYDVTHSVQRPAARGCETSQADRDMALPLAHAALGLGVDALFAEVHPYPDRALSDGASVLTYPLFEMLLDALNGADVMQGRAPAPLCPCPRTDCPMLVPCPVVAPR